MIVCNWNIIVPNGKFIELEFESFDLGSECQSVWLYAYDGENYNDPVLTQKLCGSKIPDKIISTRNKVFLEWKSKAFNSLLTSKGFKIIVRIAGKYY